MGLDEWKIDWDDHLISYAMSNCSSVYLKLIMYVDYNWKITNDLKIIERNKCSHNKIFDKFEHSPSLCLIFLHKHTYTHIPSHTHPSILPPLLVQHYFTYGTTTVTLKLACNNT